jgi:hypothetical protein
MQSNNIQLSLKNFQFIRYDEKLSKKSNLRWSVGGKWLEEWELMMKLGMFISHWLIWDGLWLVIWRDTILGMIKKWEHKLSSYTKWQLVEERERERAKKIEKKVEKLTLSVVFEEL